MLAATASLHALPMTGSRKALLAALAVVGVLALVVWQARWPLFGGRVAGLEVDLARPQGYIASPALARLPRDLVRTPLLREVLTEDFVFYYDEHETRLSVAGAIRRLAFEHELPLTERLLAQVLDEPAEMAWWLDAKGAPRHWALLVRRGALAQALLATAKVAGTLAQGDQPAQGDRQLTRLGELRVGGDTVPVLALQLSSRQTLALVAHGERLLVLSDPGLLYGSDDVGQRVLDEAGAATLAGALKDGGRAWRDTLGLAEPPPKAHQIAATAELLARGWPHFMPGVRGLRAEVALEAPASGAPAPQLALRVADTALPGPQDATLWAALPQDAAACARLPVDWTRLAAVETAGAPLAALAGRFEGPAAVCWSARSQLHTPLFVARLKGEATASDAELAAVWPWLLRGADAPRALQREVDDAPWGFALAAADASRYQPTLIRQGGWLAFSPDADWAERAGQTLARQRPALAVPPTALAYVAPAQVAELARREAMAVLPPTQETLHQAARTLLWPRLDALARWPASALVANGQPDGLGWVPVSFHTLTP